jgi:hypothetical protein
MSDASDFRVDSGLPDNPKWCGLEASLGTKGQVALLTLWCWARSHRSNGDLSGMGAGAIEAAARWRGKRGTLYAALQALRLIDPDDHLHDWQERNGWATGASARSHVGRVGAIVKWCLMRGLTPERWFELQGGDKSLLPDVQRAFAKAQERKMAKASALCKMPKGHANPTAPYPTPSPTPTPKEGGDGAGSAAGFARAGPPASPAGDDRAPPCDSDGCESPATYGRGTPNAVRSHNGAWCTAHYREHVYGPRTEIQSCEPNRVARHLTRRAPRVPYTTTPAPEDQP